jgi:hypothetical protein
VQKNRKAPERSSEQKTAYLKKVFSLNPVYDAAKMVELRSVYCGLSAETPTSTNPVDLDERKRRIKKRLESIRASFWNSTAPQLRKELDALHARDFPELKIGVDRLKTLTLYREDIQALAKHPLKEINLYNTFRRVVMLPPRKAAAVKQKYLRDLAHSDVKSKVEKMVKMIQKEYPQLYEIESSWFQQISRIKSRRVAESGSTNSDGFEFPIPGWMIGIVVVMIIRFLMMALR